ncbi:MAG: conjugal transfer protein TraF [Treponemataceae bacterium]|nr:conjugal transfer protein TraF [Treponemataceae bacterium]
MTDGFTTLFSNPAGFLASPEEWSVTEVSLSLYGPIFDMADLLIGYLGGSGSLDLSGIVGPQGLAAGGTLTGPLSFGYVGKGLGFGFFNRLSMDAKTVGLSVQGYTSADILVVGGYAFRFVTMDAHILDGGFLAKGFVRGTLPLSSSIFSVQDLVSGDIFSTKPFDLTMGVGLDLGLLYQYERWVRVGLTYHDVYSPALRSRYASTQTFLAGNVATATDYVTLKPELDLGVSFFPAFSVLERYSIAICFYADYRDILDLFMSLIPRNPILNIGLGMEATLLDVLHLRAGITDALPALGLGIDFPFMRLDLAMRGIELGLDPGVRPTYGIDLNVLFRY